MKSTNLILKKALFVSTILTLVAFNSKLKAQIIYTDIPDATPNATYSLDLNNDTIIDFVFQFDSGDKLMCKPQNNNAYSGNLVNGIHLPWALNASMNICDTNITWYGASNPGTMGFGTTIGNWVGVTNKYMALQLKVGANTYYGWARLDVLSTSTSFTIKDYAYQSIPNGCIQSGQTNLGIEVNDPKQILSVVPNPLITHSTINTSINLNNATLYMYNVAGQIVKQINNLNGRNIPISRDHLSSGLYFIQLLDDNNVNVMEKLIIAD